MSLQPARPLDAASRNHHRQELGISTGRKQRDRDRNTRASAASTNTHTHTRPSASTCICINPHLSTSADIVNTAGVSRRKPWESTRRSCCYWWRPWRFQPRWVQTEHREGGRGAELSPHQLIWGRGLREAAAASRWTDGRSGNGVLRITVKMWTWLELLFWSSTC